MLNHYEWFLNKCKSFDDSMNFENYCKNIMKCLVLLDYNIYPEEAVKLVKTGLKYIKKFYDNKETIYDCSIELGYSCG